MNGRSTQSRRTVFFCYADPAGFSGQKAAIELVMSGLTARGWLVRRLPLPVLDRQGSKPLAVAAYGCRLLVAWGRTLQLVGARGAWICIAVGQTRASFVRDLVPALMGRLLLGRSRMLFPLHSSLFMTWPVDSTDSRLFRKLLRLAGWVTALGEGQRTRLLALGLAPGRVRVLANTCSLEPLDGGQVAAKLASGAGTPTRLLYLSSLVDTKGYPEYLEALESLSRSPGPAFEAVLCGPLAASEFAERFLDLAAAEAWVESRLKAINQGAPGRIRWLRGATGEAKAALFREADIFVLPTHYAVEAQPIVLLEAMASGCAIVTSMAGEISTILDSETALPVAAPFLASVTDALRFLLAHPEARARLAQAAHRRYVSLYGRDRHLDAWEATLSAPVDPIP
jgi:glycosyltransferase involved in cell wall biosynthesis